MRTLRPSLSERLARLEQAATPHDPLALPERSWGAKLAAALKALVRWMGAELPKFLTALVVLLVGWGIKDSVDLSIKQRQLDLAYATQMQGLLQKMGDAQSTQKELESSALALASYGAPALPVLLSEMSQGGLRSSAAIDGIRALALLQREPVCNALPLVLSDRGKRFYLQTQRDVVRVLGENGCTNALKALSRYREVVSAAEQGKTSDFGAVVKDLPQPPARDTYKSLLDTIDRSLGMIKQ